MLIPSNPTVLVFLEDGVVVAYGDSREAEAYDLGEKFAFKLASAAVSETP